jgi:hypothetical protein
MNEQQIQILISILEKIESGQKEQDEVLKEIRKQSYVKQPLNPSPTIPSAKIDFTSLFERLDRNTKIVLGAIEKVKPVQEQSKQDKKINYYPLIFAAIFVGLLVCYKYYLVPGIERNMRDNTIKSAVRFYTMKNKKNKLSIDEISKSIDSVIYIQTLNEIKNKP